MEIHRLYIIGSNGNVTPIIIEEFRMIVEIDPSHKSNTGFLLSMEDPDLQIYLLSLCDNRQDVYWC